MSNDAVRARILGPEPRLLIEAPAGHGKTHEAVVAAHQLGKEMREGQRALLLSHTNAAAQEFSSRAADGTLVTTLDSFLLRLVRNYGSHFGFEPGFPVGDHQDNAIPFEDVRAYAAQIVVEAPAIAEAIAIGFPVVFVDEFQDTSESQATVVEAITAFDGSRLRMFGDPMQAIYGSWATTSDDPPIDWDRFAAEDPLVGLDTPHRWAANPTLGKWLKEVRKQLEEGKPLSLKALPDGVTVIRWSGKVPGPKSERGDFASCLREIALLGDSQNRAFLFRNKSHTRAMRRRGLRGSYLNEAGDYDLVLDSIRQVREADDISDIAGITVEFLRSTGAQIDKKFVEQAKSICTAGGIAVGSKKNILPMKPIFDELYQAPGPSGFIRAIQESIRLSKEIGWDPFRWDVLSLIDNLEPQSLVEDRIEESIVASAKTASLINPTRKSQVVTIHKSKGKAFDSVVLPFLGEQNLPRDEEGAKILYVALSRAREEIVLMLPNEGASTWFS